MSIPTVHRDRTTLEAKPVSWNGYSLRRYVPVPALSEETVAYTADLLLNDAKVGTISNDGHGGASRIQGLEERTHEDEIVDVPSGMRYPGHDFEVSVDTVLEAVAQTGRMLNTRSRRASLVVAQGEHENLTLPEVVFAESLMVHGVPVSGTGYDPVSEAVRTQMERLGATVAYFAVRNVLYVGRLVTTER